jgi:26S proteasome regulatory subunit N3
MEIDSDALPADDAQKQAPTEILPEIEMYLCNTLLSTLLREGLIQPACELGTHFMERCRSFNRRSLDPLTAKCAYYLSLAHERAGCLGKVRDLLLAMYRTACVRHDEMTQATCHNLLMRNLLAANLVAQAESLLAKTTFPESASNNQLCRHLYYTGRVQAIKLEYSDSYHQLVQALRKAPQEHSQGFSTDALKLQCIVQLLMGEVPERSFFNTGSSAARAALRPYLALTHAVRVGSVQLFGVAVEEHAEAFKRDKNFTLTQRLGHNVLKIGLRKISIAYSRITLTDVAKKLQLPSARNAEYICAKAIHDDVIGAALDHNQGCLVSSEQSDVYSTQAPLEIFHRRIVFCLESHNDAIKAMRYPPNAYKREVSNKGESEEKSIEELLASMEDDLEDDL